MKNTIIFVLIIVSTFLFNTSCVSAATLVSQCSYSYDQSFNKYSKYSIDIYYYDNDISKKYIKSNLFTNSKINRVTIELDKIQEGKNEDKFLFFSGPEAYFDSTSATNLMNGTSCPKNAYYVEDKKYCFDNDGEYCNSKFGVEIVKSEILTDYTESTDNKLSCEEYTVTTGENNENLCYIKFNVLDNNRLDIYYKDVNDLEYKKLNDSSSGFTCGGDTVSFTNTFLNNKILSRSEFNQKYVGLTKDKTYCPVIKYYVDGTSRYVVLEGSFNDLSEKYQSNGLVNGNGDKYYFDDLSFGEEVNVEDCTDLFSPDFRKVINDYMIGIRILVPIALIAFGMFDFSKAVFAGKEEDMKKAQSTFAKRLIIGVAIFFVPTIVNFLLNFMNGIYGSGIFGNGTCGIG